MRVDFAQAVGSLAYTVRVRKECVEGGVSGAEEQGVRRGEHSWVWWRMRARWHRRSTVMLGAG